ncbi:MAG: poly-beta-1,6 N-acetyl-D-glucosamine export porin PgaA [Casimicrobiaceae bacterium]|nr:poly-beta-1,6 N-acetyl-D-glucosamine export porin PgaA [Casimicrobiaceae bacterium]MDW8312305.1 poly-beta-1,6 N-acetyl-D-glucosamine export porin PgaA [Burkholderiales bacterium]
MISRAVGLLCLCFVLGPKGAAALSPQEYDALILRARAGEVRPALEAIEAALLRAEVPRARAVADLVVLNNWAERHERALEWFREVEAQAPLYVLGAAALSARRLGRHEQALALYARWLEREPDNPDAAAGRVLTLLDAGRLEEAIREVEARVPSISRERLRAPWVPLLVAAAQVRERQGRLTEALSLWLDVEQLARSEESSRAVALLLSRLGAASLARARAEQARPGTWRGEELERLRQDVTARQIGYGEVQLLLDLGLARWARLEDALAANAADRARAPRSSALEANALFDRMIAARDRVRMEEVLELEAEAQRLGHELPPYALAAAADAWLYLRQPRQARDRYREALARQAREGMPETREWRFSLVWALLEAEEWHEARRELDRLIETTPRMRLEAGLERPNPEYVRVRAMSTLLDRFGERLRESRQALDRLLAEAPHHSEVRSSHAGWLARNDYREAALAEILRLRSEQPDQLWHRISEAELELALGRPDRARAGARQLAQQYPEHRGVQRLIDELAAFDAPELRLSTVLSGRIDAQERSEANMPRDPVREADLRAYLRLTSPPAFERWRFFGDGFVSVLRLDSPERRRERWGLGADYRYDGWRLWGLLHTDRWPERTRGWAAGVEWRASDAWRFRGFYDSNTTEVALAASLAGIGARHWHASLRRQAWYERHFALGLDVLRFDDGNRRLAASGSWFELWLSEPYARLEGVLAAGGSRNSRLDAPYFNPRADAYVDYTLTGQWLSARHYEASFKQRLHGSLGAYWQDGYGTAPTFSLRYEHEWEQQRRWVVRYGAGLTRRPYDGRQELRWQFYLDAGWRPRP